uniref:Uncharacterized protein n=1 Tax=Triticum urartu TaxID=4572 RepID=A0A8R7PTD4_TRIUA
MILLQKFDMVHALENATLCSMSRKLDKKKHRSLTKNNN